MKIIANKKFEEERALYALRDARVVNCAFEGEADGESALKEAENFVAENCRFVLRYPFWHCTDFRMERCNMADTARAAMWYCRRGVIEGLTTDGIKGLRECEDIALKNLIAVSPEFGWKCRGLDFENCRVTGDYFLLDSSDIKISELELNLLIESVVSEFNYGFAKAGETAAEIHEVPPDGESAACEEPEEGYSEEGGGR